MTGQGMYCLCEGLESCLFIIKFLVQFQTCDFLDHRENRSARTAELSNIAVVALQISEHLSDQCFGSAFFLEKREKIIIMLFFSLFTFQMILNNYKKNRKRIYENFFDSKLAKTDDLHKNRSETLSVTDINQNLLTAGHVQ